MKITFVGAGNMGGAIARGLITSGLAPQNISIIDINTDVCNSFRALGCVVGKPFDRADFVVLAVKPWQIGNLSGVAAMANCVVSIAAGVSVAELKQTFDSDNIVRVMPNTAVENLAGVSFVAGNQEFTEAVMAIFKRLGQSFVVDESLFDACMAVGSCGLAYALRYARASMSGGVELGLKPDLAQKIVAQTLRGAASLLETASHPEELIDKITTPGGITIKGLNAMEREGFTNAVVEGLKNSK